MREQAVLRGQCVWRAFRSAFKADCFLLFDYDYYLSPFSQVKVYICSLIYKINAGCLESIFVRTQQMRFVITMRSGRILIVFN